jgi:hypothetical protein
MSVAGAHTRTCSRKALQASDRSSMSCGEITERAARCDRLLEIGALFDPVPDKQRCNDLVILEGVGDELDGDAQAIVAALVPFIAQSKDGGPLGSS